MPKQKKKKKYNFEFYVKPRGSDEFINRKDMSEAEWNSYMSECVQNFGKTIENIVAGRPELFDEITGGKPIEGIG